MDKPLFQIVFQGRVIPKVGEAQTRENLAKLFKASEQQLNMLFSGKRVVIKSKLDDMQARQFIAKLRDAGAVAMMEPMEGTGAAPAQPPKQPQQPASSSNSASSARPATGNRQPGSPAPTAPAPSTGAEGEFSLVDDPNRYVDPNPRPVVQIQAPVWDVLPSGSDMGEAKPDQELLDPDISSLSMAPVGERIGPQEKEVDIPDLDLSAMEMMPVGHDLTDQHEEIPLPEPDISYLRIEEPGSGS